MECELCKREVEETTDHHLTPRSMHTKKRVRRDVGKERHIKVAFCKPCHKQVHKMFTERELAYDFNTLAKLEATEKIKKWVAWIRKKE